jgi:NAD(P)-dependent dehydrogenase (short-subunit alcohol dehydrogenase family)
VSAAAPEATLFDAPPALDFDGRVVWITGESKGLGRAMAFAFAIETEMTEGLRAHDGLSADILGRTPLGRFATLAEIAACAMFLASPVAGYVTGTALFADGGWSAR